MQKSLFTGYHDRKMYIYTWDNVEKPRAVVQIIHGMVEHIERYNSFCEFLNNNGYIVVGSDLRGHGNSALEFTSLGVCEAGDVYHDNMKDQILITKYIKEKYNLPIYLFAHSYGSFVAQGYLERNSELLDKVVLSGSSKMHGFEVRSGIIVTAIQSKFIDKNKPAKFIANLSFGMFDKQFKNENIKNAWLSSDKNECIKYNNDNLCNYTMSLDFYYSLFRGVRDLYEPYNLKRIRKELPILIVSGDKDPVGKNGKNIKALYNDYVEIGIKNVNLNLYKDKRHELLNEINRDEVMFDILEFFNK